MFATFALSRNVIFGCDVAEQVADDFIPHYDDFVLMLRIIWYHFLVVVVIHCGGLGGCSVRQTPYYGLLFVKECPYRDPEHNNPI